METTSDFVGTEDSSYDQGNGSSPTKRALGLRPCQSKEVVATFCLSES